MSDSLRPHELQHARPPCPSPTPGVHSDSRPLSQWCHPAISSSVIPSSSCPQSLPASESFPMSQLFAWGGQSTGVSALASFPCYGNPMIGTKYISQSAQGFRSQVKGGLPKKLNRKWVLKDGEKNRGSKCTNGDWANLQIHILLKLGFVKIRFLCQM